MPYFPISETQLPRGTPPQATLAFSACNEDDLRARCHPHASVHPIALYCRIAPYHSKLAIESLLCTFAINLPAIQPTLDLVPCNFPAYRRVSNLRFGWLWHASSTLKRIVPVAKRFGQATVFRRVFVGTRVVTALF